MRLYRPDGILGFRMSTSKDRILDAAERVVLRDGAAHLTLDAVAHEAALSKGGLLYNFRTKEELIQAMVERLSNRFQADVVGKAEMDSAGPGRHTRAYVDACFPAPTALSGPSDHVAVALLAAVATNPLLLEPLRREAKNTHSLLLQDGIDPVLATIVRLATDGMWMADLFGVNTLDQQTRNQVIDRLHALTMEQS